MMNKTCNSLKHMGLWSIDSLVFVPAYPTSIRGTENQREARGTE